MSKPKVIRKSFVCMFHKDCSKCSMKNLCVSASGVTSELREYFLRTKGYRFPRTESMERGIIRHELYQQGMKSALNYPFHILRRDLYSGREIIFKEFQICSPFYGLRGVIDVLRIQYDKENKVMNIVAEEIKSSYWKKYFMQLAVYGLILTDLSFLFVQEVTKRKTRRITHRFYPNTEFSLNIDVILQVFGKKPIKIEWMRDNIMTDWANGISTAVINAAKQKRVLHKLGIYWLHELPPCSHCNPEMCGYYERFCSKIGDYEDKPKLKQLYFGKKKLMVQTKPKVNLAQLEGMVKIR